MMMRDSLLPAAHRQASRACSVLRRQSHHALHNRPLVQSLCLVIVELLHQRACSADRNVLDESPPVSSTCCPSRGSKSAGMPCAHGSNSAEFLSAWNLV